MRNRHRPSRNNNSNHHSSANDANYGSSGWGSRRRDQYDATQFRDPHFGSGGREFPYDREALRNRDGFNSQNDRSYANRDRMARGGNSYNDAWDHDYENRPGRSQNEDDWRHQDRNAMSHGQFHGSKSRPSQGYDQPAEENMGYSARDYQNNQPSRYAADDERRYSGNMRQDNERFESDSTRRNFRPYSETEHVQEDWSSQDRYPSRPRSKDRYY